MGGRKDSKGRVLRKGESQREKYYIYQYTDLNHRRKVVYAKDLPELRIKERQIIRDLEDGLDVTKRASMTLNEAFDRYIASRSDLKHSTQLSYNYLYNHYIRSGFGTRKISAIQYSDVRAFFLSLAVDNKLSKKTLLMINSLINQIMRIAVRDNILRTNPAEGVMHELSRKNGLSEKKRHALTVEEQTIFMKYAVEHPEFEQWIPILVIMLGTGCRIGEVLGLRWDKDVDLNTGTIYISHSLLYKTLPNGKNGFYISTPKTEAGNRTIPMMAQVKEAFLKEKANQEKRNRKAKGYKKPVVDGYTNFVFTDPKYKKGIYDPTIINRVIKRIIDSYNEEEKVKATEERRTPILLPHVTCHHLRHTFCSRYCENETNLKVIQDIMGHASITTTMNRYAEAMEATKKESIANLDNKIIIM